MAELGHHVVERPLVEPGADGADELQVAGVVVDADQQRAEQAGPVAFAELVAADDHLLGIGVLDLHPRRTRRPDWYVDEARLATIPSKRCDLVAASITSASSLTGVIVNGDIGRTDDSSNARRSLHGRSRRSCTVEGEKVEHDERMVAVGAAHALERVPTLVVVGDDLAVEDDVVVGGRRDRRGQPRPLRELRFAGRADGVEVVADAPHEHPMTIPLRLVHPPVADRYGPRRHRLHRSDRPGHARAIYVRWAW